MTFDEVLAQIIDMPLCPGTRLSSNHRARAGAVSYTPPHLAEKILTSRSALEGERKQVTVLFCDLAHSTAIAERLGAENMHTLLYEGTINQFLAMGLWHCSERLSVMRITRDVGF
jgi:hypothetical protein